MHDKTTVTIDHVSTEKLHPLFAHYGGQVTAQPTYVEIDLESGNLSADYSGDVGGGVPARVWEGDVARFDISPILTAAEINRLLDEIAPIAQEWIDAIQGDELGPHYIARRQENYLHVTYKIERLCEERRTESGGVWDAQEWIAADGMNPPLNEDTSLFDGVDLRHVSTDAELGEFAEIMRGIAIDDGVTLENLDEYLIDQREIIRANTKDV